MSRRLEIAGYASPAKRQIWRVVDGAVRDAMASHPAWLKDERTADKLRNSIVKRVVGSVMGYAETSAWGRSGFSPAAVGPARSLQAPAEGDAAFTAPSRVAGTTDSPAALPGGAP